MVVPTFLDGKMVISLFVAVIQIFCVGQLKSHWRNWVCFTAASSVGGMFLEWLQSAWKLLLGIIESNLDAYHSSCQLHFITNKIHTVYLVVITVVANTHYNASSLLYRVHNRSKWIESKGENYRVEKIEKWIYSTILALTPVSLYIHSL